MTHPPHAMNARASASPPLYRALNVDGINFSRAAGHLTIGPMQYRKQPEQAISCAVREGNGKCGPPYERNAALPGKDGKIEGPTASTDAGSSLFPPVLALATTTVIGPSRSRKETRLSGARVDARTQCRGTLAAGGLNLRDRHMCNVRAGCKLVIPEATGQQGSVVVAPLSTAAGRKISPLVGLSRPAVGMQDESVSTMLDIELSQRRKSPAVSPTIRAKNLGGSGNAPNARGLRGGSPNVLGAATFITLWW